jgi:DNA-binding response OmpR family regulator
LSNQRILVFADPGVEPPQVPREINTRRAEVISINDPVMAVAEAVAKAPDFVVLSHAHGDALNVCRQIMDYLPAERHPTFVICSERLRSASQQTGPHPDENSSGMVISSNGAHSNGDGHADRVYCHGLEIDRRKLYASIDGRALDFTVMEFSVIWALAIQPGHVRTRDQLIASCRGKSAAAGGRTIDQHVRSIRHKLGHRGDLIETVRGLGYRFRDCCEVETADGCVRGEPSR